MTQKKQHRISRIAEVFRKHYSKAVTRAFWKIERCHDPEDSMTNMSYSNVGTPLLSKNVSRNVSIGKGSRNNSSNKQRYPPKTPGKTPPRNEDLNKSSINVGGKY